MIDLPDRISSVDQLEDLLSSPTEGVIETASRVSGDMIFLGAGGKIGPSLAVMAKRASDSAGLSRRIFGVSRFTNQHYKAYLQDNGIETIEGDLLDRDFLERLPDVPNVFFLAALKFGASANPPLTWAMNVKLPGLVADKYGCSRIVTYSSGNVYPFVPAQSAGCSEQDDPDPVGEYAQTVLGRERMFEYRSEHHGTKTTIVRLNYAVEMRYGVLVDIALKVKQGLPVNLQNGVVNVIWQGDNNAVTLRALGLCESPATKLNVTGIDRTSVRDTAEKFGHIFGVEPSFTDCESDLALLADASQATSMFGPPRVSVDQMIDWIGSWLLQDLPVFDKPTSFEVSDGRY